MNIGKEIKEFITMLLVYLDLHLRSLENVSVIKYKDVISILTSLKRLDAIDKKIFNVLQQTLVKGLDYLAE